MELNEKVKDVWEKHKKEICVGGAISILATKKFVSRNNREILKKAASTFGSTVGSMPTRPIPKTKGFKILDIGEDIDDGCIVWMDGCKLADCGKFGKELSKIERVDLNTMITLAILAKEKLKL